MIKVLIAEDSPVMQELLIHAISSDPIFDIVGVAWNGEEAVVAVKQLKPDIVAMDWQMPKLDVREATRIIMETTPTPIVIVTGSSAADDLVFSFSMIEAGAIAIVKKPPSPNHPDYVKDKEELILTLKLMSEVKMVKRISNPSKEIIKQRNSHEIISSLGSEIDIIAIGASTGGPQALKTILSNLPKTLEVPILIVQHISSGFTLGLAEWLGNTTGFLVNIASHGEYAKPGIVYIAPDNLHMGIETGRKIVLSNHVLENGSRPSVGHLFRTVAQEYGSRAIAVLLTGMGHDGASELKQLRDKGAITFAQDKESSVVFGMPGEAIKLNGALHILNPEEISLTIASILNKKKGVNK